MRILMFNHEFPPIGGGSGWVSYFFGKHFVEAGHDVYLITSQFQNLPEDEDVEGIHIHRVPALRSNKDVCGIHEMLTYAVSSSLHGLRSVCRHKPDIVQIFSGIPAGGGGYLLKRIHGSPYVVFLSGRDVPSLNPDPPYYRWIYALLNPIIRGIWRNAGAVVACSDGLRGLALQTAPELTFKVIPDGLDLKRFSPVPRRVAPTRVRILTIGRLIPRKGFQLLIQALPQVIAQARVDFEIEIVGDGPYRGTLVAMAKELKIDRKINFAGSVSYSELPQKYREADVFVLCSLAEGMPLVVLEAMGTGLPIVASRVQGIEDLVRVGVNGTLFPPNDVDGLANSLVGLINDGESRVRMGKSSIGFVQKYDWKNIANSYLAIYERILEEQV
jgi:glycosyltransferase involved in cell wall biosynthesis